MLPQPSGRQERRLTPSHRLSRRDHNPPLKLSTTQKQQKRKRKNTHDTQHLKQPSAATKRGHTRTEDIPALTAQNRSHLFGPAFSSDNAGDGPKDPDKNSPLSSLANRQVTPRESLTSHTLHKTTKIPDNNEPLWNMLDETDTQDASDLCAELDQLIAAPTPKTKKTVTVSTHNTTIGQVGTTSGRASCNESNLSANSEAIPPTTRQATAREALSCLGTQSRTSHTPCTDDSLRPILEKAGILHSLEASGYFGDRTSKDYNGRLMDSLVEHLVQKESRDKLEQLVPEKLELIQSIIEIKEPQRKLKEQDRHKWICINWNLDRADLQKLRKIRDSLCGQKISLDKLIKRHNATTTDKNEEPPQIKKMPNQPEAMVNAKPKATKNAKRSERRRKTKPPKDSPCDLPTRSTQFWDQTFRAPNRPPQPDPHMELEEASALLNDQYDAEEFTLEESWAYSQIRRIADELMAKERRHRTAKTYIRIPESHQQSGKPHLPPSHKHTIHHLHIILHHPPIPPHNHTLLIESLTIHHKGFSPYQQEAPLYEDSLGLHSLHTTVFFPPQTLQPARITPRGRKDGPKRAQNEHTTPTAMAPNSSPKIFHCRMLAAIKKFCICVVYCPYSYDVG